ncbi:hypothetical protein [Chryseobacterium nepalense]|uniref:hypothetical protein n=1 Tax=Chryseobacterium nepalense TaxID=1854498 RepID=UPI002E05AB84|nr:hypothetical protein [Chryseobacterium nepalense]
MIDRVLVILNEMKWRRIFSRIVEILLRQNDIVEILVYESFLPRLIKNKRF